MRSCASAPARAAERGVAEHFYRLIGNLIPEIGQGPQPVIAPVPVLARHANNQPLDLQPDPRLPATGFEPSNLRATSLRYQARIVSGRACDFAENLAAQPMTDLAERGSLGVRELQSTLLLGLQDAVFGGQIFVPRQQLLVHRPRDVSQDPRPIHNGPPAPTVRDGITHHSPKCTGPPREPPY